VIDEFSGSSCDKLAAIKYAFRFPNNFFFLRKNVFFNLFNEKNLFNIDFINFIKLY
jgi:hypothetical protein